MRKLCLLVLTVGVCGFFTPDNSFATDDLIPLSKINPCTRQVGELMKQRNSSTESIEQYLARRQQLEAFLPAYSRDANTIFFQYDMPGLEISIQHSAYKGMHTSGVVPYEFWLSYDPQQFSRLSIIRRTLGNTPQYLTFDDVASFSQSSLVSSEGIILEVYLKRGGLLMISRDTGQVLFYPPGTNVDGAAERLIKGSAKAVWDIAKGLAGEAQCAICKYTGVWFTDKDVLDVEIDSVDQRRLGPPE